VIHKIVREVRCSNIVVIDQFVVELGGWVVCDWVAGSGARPGPAGTGRRLMQ